MFFTVEKLSKPRRLDDCSVFRDCSYRTRFRIGLRRFRVSGYGTISGEGVCVSELQFWEGRRRGVRVLVLSTRRS